MEKEKILDEIKKYGFPGKEVAIGLEEFFEGNNDEGSIGANLFPHPTIEAFYKVLKEVKSSPKTENVLVRVADAEDSDWFYSDTVYIVGDFTLDEVKGMVTELQPTEVYEKWMYGQPVNVSEVKNKVYSIWWD